MPEFQTISKQHPAFPEYLDFDRLRAIGIEHLQRMSGQVWSDYNLHDPGVTILEVLCYAITDLGYRNNLDIKDLLTHPPGTDPQGDNNFFTPDQILTCNPVTALDLRKRLIDIEGVRNAWIEPYGGYRMVQQDNQQWVATTARPPQAAEAPAQKPEFKVKGLYTVCLDLEASQQRDACGQVYDDDSAVLDRVYAVLGSYRNLCEDIHDVIVLGEEAIGLRANVDLEATANAEDVLVEVYLRVQSFLAPQVKFYTLQDMLARGKDPTEIFAGRPSALGRHDRNAPRESAHSDHSAPSHGFIDTEELEALKLPEQLRTSDLYAVLLGIPGVRNVTNLSIRSYINGVARSQEEPWWLNLTPNYRPVLGIGQSQLLLYQGGVQVAVDRDRAQRRYAQQALKHLKAHRSDAELDLSVPQGIHYSELAEHYSIHHDFPLTYGISEDGLPATATAERKGQAKQLQGYLVFFDQILANYLMQLSKVRELFSWDLSGSGSGADGKTDQIESDVSPTYFPQRLNFPGVEAILKDSAQTIEFLSGLSEDRETALERRSRFLDHMLARFAESFTDYVLINYRQSRREESLERQHATDQMEVKIIADKTRFLGDYPALSRDRFRALNYRQCHLPSGWDSFQVSGFEERIGHLLGMHDVRQRSLIHYEVVDQPSDFVVQVGWGEGGRPLICRQTFPTLAAAQRGLDALLEAMLTPARYQPLVYRNPYHSLEIVDTDGSSLVIYDHAYPTAAARNAATGPLVRRVGVAISQQLVAQIQQATTSDEFELNNLPEPVITLLSELLRALRPALEDALARGLEAVLGTRDTERLLEQASVQIDRLQREWQTTLENSGQSFLRDDMLEWNTDEESGEIGFVLKLAPKTQPQLRFVSAQRYNTRAEARDAALRALDRVQDERFYHPISLRSEDVDPGVTVDGKLTTYGFAIADAERCILAGMDNALGFKTAAERDATMLALHSSQSTMRIEAVREGYQYSFIAVDVDVDPLQQIILTSVDTYATRPLAWAAVQTLNQSLHELSCYGVQPGEGANYHLVIQQTPGGEHLAISQALSGDDGDRKRQSIFRWVNSLSPFVRYIQPQLSDRASGTDYRFQIVDRRGEICLEGCQWFDTCEAARDHCYRDAIGVLWAAGAITPIEANGRYTFALRQTNADGTTAEVANHPRDYATAAERDEAIQRLKTLVRTAHLNVNIEQQTPGCRGEVNLDRQTQLQTTQHYSYALAHLEVGYRLPAPDNSSEAESSTLSEHTFSPFAQWWEQSRWDAVRAALNPAVSLELRVQLQATEPGPAGYRFYLAPGFADDAALRWRFVSSRSYDSYQTARNEGERAQQLLSTLNSPVPTSDPAPRPPFPPAALWPLQQEHLHTVNSGLVLIDAKTRQEARDRARHHGDTLIRMAESDDIYRRVDPQPSALGEGENPIAAYSWALLGPETHRAIAIHPECYADATKRNDSIAKAQRYIDDEGLHVVEHILLRSPPSDPQPESEAAEAPPPTLPIFFATEQGLAQSGDGSTRPPLDPYSFWLTVVLPAWPKRFQQSAFRQFVERTLRQEAPAHIALKIAWLDLPQMHRFEAAYKRWLEQLSLAACQGSACGQAEATQTLLNVLADLKSIYPTAHLSGLATAGLTQNPIVLNQTPLGTNHE